MGWVGFEFARGMGGWVDGWMGGWVGFEFARGEGEDMGVV